MFLSIIGATTRYIASRIFIKSSKRNPWNSYWEYQDMPEKEFSDKILGGIVIAIAAFIIVRFTERFS